jgi:hypothetical protein
MGIARKKFFKLTLIYRNSILFSKKVKSPANSPDLNPIELLWPLMKHYIRSKMCKSFEDIVVAIWEFQQTITVELCIDLIETLHEVYQLNKLII